MSGLQFLPLVGIALLFYLLVIRPQSRRQRELRGMQSSLDIGDEVMLTSGIYGTITALDDATVQVEVAQGVTLKVVRGAIGIVERDPGPDSADHERTDQPDELPHEENN